MISIFKKPLFRFLSVFFLSFVLLASSSPLQLFLNNQFQAQAQSFKPVQDQTHPFEQFKTHTETELSDHQRAESFKRTGGEQRQKDIEELKASVIDPGKEASIDPFQMLKQSVVDERRRNLDNLIERELLQDYRDRVEFLETDIKNLMDIIAHQKIKRDMAVNENQRVQSQFYLDDAQSRLDFARIQLDDLRSQDPEKQNIELMIDQRLRTRHYWGNRMELVVTREGQTVTRIKQRDFTQSLSPDFFAENPLSRFYGNGEMSFGIAHPGGALLHRFFVPVSALFFFGEFLVYVESSPSGKTRDFLPIRFIDLNYVRVNVGNAPLPVFTLPLRLNEEPKDFKIEKGFLKIGNQSISYAQMALVSRMSQVLFNVNVSLVDPESFERAKPLIDQILVFLKKSMLAQGDLFRQQFEKALAADEYLKQFTDQLKEVKPSGPQSQDFIQSAFTDGQLNKREYESLKQKLLSEESLVTANRTLFESRRMMNRIRLFMKFLSQPRPEGSPKLQKALLLLVSSDEADRTASWKFIEKSFSFKLLKYGTVAGVSLVLMSSFPEFYKLFIYKSLDLINAVNAHFMGYMEYIDYGRSYVHLSKSAFIRVATGVTYFYDSYIADQRWLKLIYGFTVIFTEILKPLAAIHFAVNSFSALKGTWVTRSLSQGQLSWLASFYYHSRKATEKYWKEKSMDMENSGGGKVSDITPREEQLLLDYLKRLKQGRDSTEDLIREIENGKTELKFLFSDSDIKALVDRLSPEGFKKVLLSLLRRQKTDGENAARDYEKAKDSHNRMRAFSESMGETYQEVAENFPKNRIRAVRVALAETFLSYPAVIRSFRTALLLWNYPYLTQTFFYSPSKWFMFLIYPNFFNVTMNSRQGEQHFPSRYNGGLESWPGKLHRRISGTVHSSVRLFFPDGFGRKNSDRKTHSSPDPWTSRRGFFDQMILSEKALKDLGEFETEVIKVEAIAIKLARERALTALMESIGDPDKLQMIFDSSQKRETVSTGISQLYDSKIKKLTPGERLFYRAYFTRTFELLMQSFVSDMTSTRVDPSMAPSDFAKQFVRELKEGQIDSIDMTEESLKKIRQDMERNIDYEQVRNWAYGLANKGENFLKKMDIQFRMKLLQSVHPENEQLARVFTASRMAKKPQAMDRAARVQISSVFSSIPIAIGSTLLLFASVQSGLLQPFDPTGMNTNTHLHYMSRYLFWAGFIPSILLGIVAGTWMKVQEDSRIERQGGFDRTVKYSDGQRGFWRYYFKNIFKNPANNWRANQLHYLKIIWHNMPAASVTMIAASLYGLGRVDLGIFISGSVVIFATPLVGFGMQLGQAFELASNWVKSKIPGKFKAHRAAMQYVDFQIQMYKIKQSYIMRFFDIIVASGIMGELFTLADNAQYGTRAFIRLIFGGDTLTEIVNNLTEKMIEAFKNIPGVKPGMETVKAVFTNNFEAWERFPEDLLKANPGVEQVRPNPSLPQNTLGEVMGKATALFTSLGTMLATPYVGSHLLQSINEKRLQRKGSQLRCSTLFAK